MENHPPNPGNEDQQGTPGAAASSTHVVTPLAAQAGNISDRRSTLSCSGAFFIEPLDNPEKITRDSLLVTRLRERMKQLYLPQGPRKDTEQP